jgi:transcriptional regulator with XRE-family HTH domain
MAILAELARATLQRRTEIGLTQEAVAALTGLSRATVNALESGRLRNLSLVKAENLANQLGLAIVVTGLNQEQRGDAIQAAARSASVSYGKELPPSVLEEALVEGTVPPGYIPHLRAVLDDAPVYVLAAMARELEERRGEKRTETWQRMRTIARVLKARRALWQS